MLIVNFLFVSLCLKMKRVPTIQQIVFFCFFITTWNGSYITHLHKTPVTWLKVKTVNFLKYSIKKTVVIRMLVVIHMLISSSTASCLCMPCSRLFLYVSYMHVIHSHVDSLLNGLLQGLYVIYYYKKNHSYVSGR